MSAHRGGRHWVSKIAYNESLRREELLAEELEQVRQELAISIRRSEVLGAVNREKTVAEYMLGEVAEMVPHLEENKATASAARRIRAILGINPIEEKTQ